MKIIIKWQVSVGLSHFYKIKSFVGLRPEASDPPRGDPLHMSHWWTLLPPVKVLLWAIYYLVILYSVPLRINIANEGAASFPSKILSSGVR